MDGLSVSAPLNIQDVGSAPRLPGLYVWYAKFKVEEADWRSGFAGGNEAASKNLLKALREQSLKYSRQEMSIRAESNFSAVWNGTLSEDPTTKWGTSSEQSEGGDAFDERLQRRLKNDATREALVALLNLGFPLFFAPLYIGKAADQTLQQRLGQHAARYLNLWEKYLKDRQIAERMSVPKNFAERAIKLGFSPDDLFCITLAVDSGQANGLDPETTAALIDSAEWLLNRWAIPTLGRQ